MENENAVEIWQENPLQNSVILQTLFRHNLNGETVLRRRLVCRSWREASSFHWQHLKKSPVLCYGPSDEKDHDPALLMALPEFYELFEDNDPTVASLVSKPPERVSLYRWKEMYPGNAALQDSSLDQWFWAWSATAHLTHVTLTDCHFKESIAVFEEPFLRALPAIQQLTLRDCIVHPSAVRKITQAHEKWARQPGRANCRRELTAATTICEKFQYARGDPLPNSQVFTHTALKSLDVTLKSVDNEPLLVWGPLLQMLPQLRDLRVGGVYEEAHVPAFPPLSESSWKFTVCNHKQVSKLFFNPVLGYEEKPSNLELEYPNCSYVSNLRPPTVGSYFELWWEDALLQVAPTLEKLDLLDFDGKAQDYGVFSSVMLMEGYPLQVNPNDDNSSRLRLGSLNRLAVDIGMDCVFADRDLATLARLHFRNYWEEMSLFRAPGARDFPNTSLTYYQLSTLELWGNVTCSWDLFGSLQWNLKTLRWNTSCYDPKHKGKRVKHLLESGKKMYPIFNQDLVANTGRNYGCTSFLQMRHLELDYPLSASSWRRLSVGIHSLEILVAVLSEDAQLEQVTQLWQRLHTLRLNHRSRVTAAALERFLPASKALKVFHWETCACVQHLFYDAEHLRQVETKLTAHFSNALTLPWGWTAEGKLSFPEVCEQEQFETALLEAAKLTEEMVLGKGDDKTNFVNAGEEILSSGVESAN